ncbi:unnamed protein product [Musa acuminata subsp. burmannicoides]
MRNSIRNPWCSSFMGADIAMISMCLKSPAVLTKLLLAPSQIPSQGGCLSLFLFSPASFLRFLKLIVFSVLKNSKN